MRGRFTQHYTWAEVHTFLSMVSAPLTYRRVGPESLRLAAEDMLRQRLLSDDPSLIMAVA